LRSEFARVARTEPWLGQAFSRFLATAYEVKSFADYATEPQNVSSEAARAAIESAERMIDSIADVPGSTDAPGAAEQIRGQP
jgi:hypothetical protein